MTTVSALPTPPSTSSPANFDTRADAFLGALPTFVTEVNLVAGEVNANAATASADAATASAAADAATVAAGATTWNVATAYSVGQAAISGVNLKTYRATVAVTGGLDPALSTTGAWADTQTPYLPPINLAGSSITLEAGSKYRAVSGTNTPYLPATPGNGLVLGPIRKVSSSASLTLNRNGKTIAGLAENFVIDEINIDVFLTYVASTGDWELSF